MTPEIHFATFATNSDEIYDFKKVEIKRCISNLINAAYRQQSLSAAHT
jgi:hypothetical protein